MPGVWSWFFFFGWGCFRFFFYFFFSPQILPTSRRKWVIWPPCRFLYILVGMLSWLWIPIQNTYVCIHLCIFHKGWRASQMLLSLFEAGRHFYAELRLHLPVSQCDLDFSSIEDQFLWLEVRICIVQKHIPGMFWITHQVQKNDFFFHMLEYFQTQFFLKSYVRFVENWW